MTVVKFPEKEMSLDDIHECSLDIASSLDRALELAILLEGHYINDGLVSFQFNRLINVIQESFYQVEDIMGVTRD